MMKDNDPRWEATLEYTTGDDGIWLVYGDQEVNLGFWPTAKAVVDALDYLRIEDGQADVEPR